MIRESAVCVGLCSSPAICGDGPEVIAGAVGVHVFIAVMTVDDAALGMADRPHWPRVFMSMAGVLCDGLGQPGHMHMTLTVYSLRGWASVCVLLFDRGGAEVVPG